MNKETNITLWLQRYGGGHQLWEVKVSQLLIRVILQIGDEQNIQTPQSVVGQYTKT